MQTSTHHLILELLCSLVAAFAIWLLPLTLLPRLLLLTLLLVISITRYPHRQHHTLTHIHRQDGSWSVSGLRTNRSTGEFHGHLVSAGYRSANVLVLVIQSELGQLVRIPVWSDSVSGRSFSYLHLQLAYAATSLDQQSRLQWHWLRYTGIITGRTR